MAARGDGLRGRSISARVMAAGPEARRLWREINLLASRRLARDGSGSPPPFREEPQFEDLAEEVNNMGEDFNERPVPPKEVRAGKLTNSEKTDKATKKWLKMNNERLGEPKKPLETAVYGNTGTTRSTRKSGPAVIDNLFGLQDMPKAPARFKPKPQPLSSMKGPLMGYRTFGTSQTDVVGEIAAMRTETPPTTGAKVSVGAAAASRQGNSLADQGSPGMGAGASTGGGGGGAGGSRDAQDSVETGVSVGAAAASRQGNSLADQGSPGMGAGASTGGGGGGAGDSRDAQDSVEAGVSVGAAAASQQRNSNADQGSPGMGAGASTGGGGGGGGGIGSASDSRDPQGSVEAGVSENKRERDETWPVSVPTSAYRYVTRRSAVRSSIDVVGAGCGAGGPWARVGAGDEAGGWDGADEDDLIRPRKRARVSGGASGNDSVDGVTDGTGRSGSEDNLSDTEGASGVGGMACDEMAEMAGKQSWQDGDDEDGGSGGEDGSGGGSLDGGHATAQGSGSNRNAQDCAS